MKKIYALIGAFTFFGMALAQNAEVYTFNSEVIGGTDISGTQIDFTVNADGTLKKHFYVKNVSGAQNNLKVKRTILSEPAGWDDYLCWGRPTTEFDILYQNTCYPASSMNMIIWDSPGFVTIPADSGAELITDYIVNGPGTACYRYVFLRGAVAWDSLDICVTKAVSIEEKEELAFTVYPNPANNYINLTTKGTDGTSLLKITDVFGKVVYEESISETKKLDVSDFKNGVYLLTVIEDGNAIKTKRIVIKH